MIRRQPLQRKTPMKRSRMKRKRRRNDKPEVRYEWMEEHQSCAICWRRVGQIEAVLHCHHLVSGAGRKDIPGNLLSLCDRCHRHFHEGGELDDAGRRLEPLHQGHMLYAKRESDSEHYDESVICQLLGRKSLPEKWLPTPLPQWAMEERERNLRA